MQVNTLTFAKACFRNRLPRLLMGSAISISLLSNAAVAQIEKDKPLTIMVGYAAGGANDIYARLLGRYIVRSIGASSLIVQNLPGAGSIEAANRLYNSAPRDGLTIGALGRGIVTEPLFGNANARYDALRFNWLGSVARETATVFSFRSTKFTNLSDIQANEMTVGATGAGGEGFAFARLLNETLGTKLKPVLGYKGSADILQAVERGEVDGSAGLSWGAAVSSARPHWIRDRDITVLLNLGRLTPSELSSVPNAFSVIKKPEDQRLYSLFAARLDYAFPFVAPPNVNATVVERLRQAFDEAVKDPGFLEEAKRAMLEVDPLSGQEMTDIIKTLYETDRSIIERAMVILKP
jgi:tripartite-type tricarboxylate transporter receptor subunit TctC